MTNPTYSPVSSTAVVSATLGFASVLGLLEPEFAIIAVPGIGTAIAAVSAIRKYELRGRTFAQIGFTLSVAFAVLTPLWHMTRFNSEAPPGYERLDFASLAASKDQGLDRFVAKKVCLKGYGLPPNGVPRAKLTEVTLSPDGNSRKTDSTVIVQLLAGDSWDWQFDAVAVSGTLVRNPNASTDPKSVKFVLQEGSVRPSKTRFCVVSRAADDGGC